MEIIFITASGLPSSQVKLPFHKNSDILLQKCFFLEERSKEGINIT